MEERGSERFRFVVSRVDELKDCLGAVLVSVLCGYTGAVILDLKRLAALSKGIFLEDYIGLHTEYSIFKLNDRIITGDERERMRMRSWADNISTVLTLFNNLTEVNGILSEIYEKRQSGDDRVFLEDYLDLVICVGRCNDSNIKKSILFRQFVVTANKMRDIPVKDEIHEMEKEIMHLCWTKRFCNKP